MASPPEYEPRRRVLVIDDSELALAKMEELLGEQGFRVACSLTFEEALALLEDFRPDIVVSDLHMPDVDGIEVVQRLKELAPDVPVVIHSAETSIEPVLATLRAGAFEFVNKAGDPRTLLISIARAIDHARISHQNHRLAEIVAEANRAIEERNARAAELLQAREEITQKNEELQRASNLKSQFLANMSHELRTPMNAIIGFTDLVLSRAGPGLEGRNRNNLEKVLYNARHLLELINGVLDLSKIEAGRLELSPEEFDPAALLEQTALMAEVLLKEKPVKLVRKFEDGLPPMFADKTKLRQVVLNLLGNACKFTAEGEVSLSAHLEETEAIARFALDGAPPRAPSGRIVVIDVSDSGIGMAPGDVPSIFEEFRQVGDLSVRGQGTGLGLAIVKKLVELMGGAISATSTLGTGTAIRVELPLAAATDRGQSAAPPSATPLADPGGNDVQAVIVVDDEPDSIMTVREMLAGEPWRVIGAFTAEEGFRLALKENPVAMLIAGSMPDRDGWSLVQQLKESPEFRHLPLVIVAASREDRGFEAGHLAAPIEPSALAAVLAPLRR